MMNGGGVVFVAESKKEGTIGGGDERRYVADARKSGDDERTNERTNKRTNERTKTKLTRPRIRRTSRSALHLTSEEESWASPSSDDSIFSPSLSSLRSACMIIDANRGAILSIIIVATILSSSSSSSSSSFAAATARAAAEMANATTSRLFFDRRLYVDGGNSHPRQSTTANDDDDPFFLLFLLVVFLDGSIGR